MIKFYTQWSNVEKELNVILSPKEKVDYLEQYLYIARKFLLAIEQRQFIYIGLKNPDNIPQYYSGDNSMNVHFDSFTEEVIQQMREFEFDEPRDNSFITFEGLMETSNLLLQTFKDYALPRIELDLEQLKVEEGSESNKTRFPTIRRIWEGKDQQLIKLLELLVEQKFIEIKDKQHFEQLKNCFLEPYSPIKDKIKWNDSNILLVYTFNSLENLGLLSKSYKDYRWIVVSGIFFNKYALEITNNNLRDANQKTQFTKKIRHTEIIDAILASINC
jgi:hypothetical protein